uniref:Uncharacterized protein n=1 Tax=Fagus sylvatica TaxID=28930 RepID=A0A2N9G7I3_FAGSY
MQKLKRDLEDLSSRKADVNKELEYAESLSLKKRRQQVENWLTNVERRLLGRVQLGKQVEEMTGEVTQLVDHGRFPVSKSLLGVIPLPQLSLAPLLSEIRLSRCQEADSSPKGPTATLKSAVPGLRSRHRRYRWKALEIFDSTAQKTVAFDTGRALTRRLKIQCAATLLHAPPRARLLHCHVSPRRSNQKNYHFICAFCKHRGHTIDRCNMRAGILQRSAVLTASESIPSSDAVSFDPVLLTTPTYSIADLQALFSQVQALSSSASNSALSVTPGISSEWFLDSACCNHMTDNPHLTSATLLLSYLLLPLRMAPP